MSIREELILKVLAKEDSVVELAEQYGVSRKTIYKWLSRYESKGLGGLVDESRRPKRSPMKTSAELALEIVQLRKEHPRWGPKKIFERLFDKFGLPRAIQSDNGPPFASTRALGGLTPLSAWWVSLGIRVVRSRPGRPTDNGAHERMHVDMRFDLEDRAAQDLVAQQRACDDWATTFNHVRPHEALQQRTPAEVYRVSTRRPIPRTIGGFPEGCRMVRVNGHGNIHADGWRAYVNHALCHYTVGLEFREHEVRVWFFDVLLGAFDPRTQQSVEPIASASERT